MHLFSPAEDAAVKPQKAETLRYVDDLFRYAVALVHNRAEAEDLVQETYVRALKAMNSLRPGSNLKVWMLTILRNVWRNQLRSRRSAPVADFDDQERVMESLPAQEKDPYSAYVSNLESESVRVAIEKLPVEFREILMLREYDELSYQEIASLLDCPVGTVMSRLGRARSRLRMLLSGLLQTVSML
jgi:RNA polymerase sigma-70 factor, ECF subfamily